MNNKRGMLAQLIGGLMIIVISGVIMMTILGPQMNAYADQVQQTYNGTMAMPEVYITAIRWSPYILAVFMGLIGLKIFMNMFRDFDDDIYVEPEQTKEEIQKEEEEKRLEKYEYDSDTSTQKEEINYEEKKKEHEERMKQFYDKKILTEKDLT